MSSLVRKRRARALWAGMGGMSARQSPNWGPGPTAPGSVSSEPLRGRGFPNAHLLASLAYSLSMVTSERRESQGQSTEGLFTHDKK